MSLHPEWWLCGWTVAAAAWWIIAIVFVGRVTSRGAARAPAEISAPTLKLSIFKPIPSIHDDSLFAAVESFASQLDEHSELLLGIEEQHATRWQSFRRDRVKLICLPRPAQFLSPKVSWFHTLAGHATGELWLWSDADMVLPAGGLASLRQEFASSGCALLTTPYVVRQANGAATLEALFVNAEFYPGVLAAAGRMNFAMGAGMMFRADDFRQRVKWEALGCRLADDNLLGQTLTPVRVSDLTLETLPASVGWGDAIAHYARWHKTVRWCRPGGYAAQLLILPVLGWAVIGAWPFALATMQLEVLAAWLLCRQAGMWERPSGRDGCRSRPEGRSHKIIPTVLALELWSMLRAVTWLACWLPWPVTFHSQRRKWYSLYRSEPIT